MYANTPLVKIEYDSYTSFRLDHREYICDIERGILACYSSIDLSSVWDGNEEGYPSSVVVRELKTVEEASH